MAITTQPRGQATRADILQTARRLFSEHGYHSTGLSDIQAATGLTKGAFYHHFRSKEDLALAVLESAKADYAERWLGPAQGHASPSRRIEALLDGVIELNAQPEWCTCQMMATLCAELTASNGDLREAVRSMQINLFEMWRNLIVQAQQAGEIGEQMDAAAWAQWINNTLLGGLLARKLGSARVPAEKVINVMKTLLLKPPARSGLAGGGAA